MGDCNVLVGPPKYIAGSINRDDHDYLIEKMTETSFFIIGTVNEFGSNRKLIVYLKLIGADNHVYPVQFKSLEDWTY